MAIDIDKVHPGDLITASYVNSLVDALDSLQEQIDALSMLGASPGGTKPVIVQVSPSPDVPTGALMTISGHNFAVPVTLNTVTVDGTPLDDFQPGSDDETIIVGIPGDLAGVPGSKSLVVSTAVGGASDPKSVHFVAGEVALVGAAVMTNVSGDVGTIEAGGAAVLFQFQVDTAAMNGPEQFILDVAFDNAQGASADAWEALTSYVGTTGTSHTFATSPVAPVTVGVRVAAPAGATSVDLSVQAVSVHNAPASSSAPQTVSIVVGEAPPPADPSIALALGTNTRLTIHPNASGTGLDIKYGATAIVNVDTTMGHAGQYEFAGAIDNPDTGIWQILDLPLTQTYTDGQGEVLQFRLKLVPTSPPADSVSRTFTLTATRQDDDEIGHISNFLNFAIGGFTS